MKFISLTLLISLLSTIYSFGADSLGIINEGKNKYVKHRVEPKETLYSISRRYSVTIDELYKNNPQIENGLRMYTELKVPIRYTAMPKEVEKKRVETSRKHHIVKKGETLYAISKKYKVSLQEIKAINELENNNIGLGDIIWLERIKNISSTDTRPQKNTSDVTPKKYATHVVQASETLYSISKAKNTTVDELKKLNKLKSNSLSIGQELKIPKAINTHTKSTQIANNNQTPRVYKFKFIEPIPEELGEKKDKLDTIYVKTDNSEFRTKREDTNSGTLITEQGFAMKIESTDYTTKYLALHKTAPIGTKVRITNQMTGKNITAQVVGALPNTALNQKLLLRLSSSAFDQLGAIDKKIPITSDYLEE